MRSACLPTLLGLIPLLLLPLTATSQVPDVLKAVAALDSTVSRQIAFRLNEELPAGGHLQGIQWLEDTLLLSGSSADQSYVLTVSLKNDGAPKPATFTRLLDSPFRHSGGLQVMANRYVAIGLEDNQRKDRSKIWILDATQSMTKPIITRVAI